MSRHRSHLDPEHLYFVTTKAVQGKPIFDRPYLANIVLGSLRYMRLNHWIKLYAYVLMPNHIHLIVKYLDEHQPSQVLRDFKKFTAKEIIGELERRGERRLLSFLEAAASNTKKQTHKVWEDGYFDKSIFSEPFLFQKMDYIHHNPLQPHWSLAERPEEYRYSSARNYALHDDSVMQIDHCSELLHGAAVNLLPPG